MSDYAVGTVIIVRFPNMETKQLITQLLEYRHFTVADNLTDINSIMFHKPDFDHITDTERNQLYNELSTIVSNTTQNIQISNTFFIFCYDITSCKFNFNNTSRRFDYGFLKDVFTSHYQYIYRSIPRAIYLF